MVGVKGEVIGDWKADIERSGKNASVSGSKQADNFCRNASKMLEALSKPSIAGWSLLSIF